MFAKSILDVVFNNFSDKFIDKLVDKSDKYFSNKQKFEIKWIKIMLTMKIKLYQKYYQNRIDQYILNEKYMKMTKKFVTLKNMHEALRIEYVKLNNDFSILKVENKQMNKIMKEYYIDLSREIFNYEHNEF